MEAGEALIKAAALFKVALEENDAILDTSLTGCPVLYVPKMPREHREIWYEECLYLFSCEDIAYDVIMCVSNPHRKVFLSSMPPDIGIWLQTEVEYNLHMELCTLSKNAPAYHALLPIHYRLDSQDLIKTVKLLAFA